MTFQTDIKTWCNAISSQNQVALSRAITLVESQQAAHREKAVELLDALNTPKNAIRLGITGVPGVGKSTFIEAFGMYLLEKGHRVAVLAIDPSSQQSGGSILGDKVRMPRLSQAKNAFIRPTPSSGTLGGVAPHTREVIQLCEAAGFDFILIETVGVGQSEVEVAHLCDIFMLLMLPNAGDEIQGIKRGIMELADLILINKADGAFENAAKAAQLTFKRALHFFASPSELATEALCISALTEKGVDKVYNWVKNRQELAIKSGFWQQNRNEQALFWFNKMLQRNWQAKCYEIHQEAIQKAQKDIINGKNIQKAVAEIMF